MYNIAVIDTETTWNDDVMSIGIALSSPMDFKLEKKRYYILTPYINHGGMYTYALYAGNTEPDMVCSREKAMADLRRFLSENGAEAIFAYNAAFDYHHLPELNGFKWYDILKIAAYRQYNRKIPENAECFKTGRLRSGYGVENIYRMLSGDRSYCELHNALTDAVDELAIMRLLKVDLNVYTSNANCC